MRKRTKSIDGARVDVGLLDEKAINPPDQSSQRTKSTKNANVRWADIGKRGLVNSANSEFHLRILIRRRILILHRLSSRLATGH